MLFVVDPLRLSIFSTTNTRLNSHRLASPLSVSPSLFLPFLIPHPLSLHLLLLGEVISTVFTRTSDSISEVSLHGLYLCYFLIVIYTHSAHAKTSIATESAQSAPARFLQPIHLEAEKNPLNFKLSQNSSFPDPNASTSCGRPQEAPCHRSGWRC